MSSLSLTILERLRHPFFLAADVTILLRLPLYYFFGPVYNILRKPEPDLSHSGRPKTRRNLL